MRLTTALTAQVAQLIAGYQRECVVLSWHHVLWLPGPPAPSVLLPSAMVAVAAVCDLLLTHRPPLPASAVLRVCGPWVMLPPGALTTSDPGLLEGYALVGTLNCCVTTRV